MKPLKDVLLCVTACVLSLGIIIALDMVTGVPFSYGAPLAALISLIPYALILTRGRAVRRRSGARAHAAGTAGRVDPPADDVEVDGDDRPPCAIHSVIFLGGQGSRVRPGVGMQTQDAA